MNRKGLVFVGRRIGMPAMPAWRPQGGIDQNALQAALRELREEIGTDRAEILGESPGWLKYDLPDEISGGLGRGAVAASGRNGSPCASPGIVGIDLAAEHPEFDAWKWVSPERLSELIVSFKRQLYFDILAEFRGYCAAAKKL